MITLSKSGNAVKFTFDENDHYLQNGTIEVPVNSLALIMDNSDMVTFRKSASNDIFVSANYSEFGMSKAELESWYKTNMVGSSGGETGGTTPEEVQEMIDSSLIPYSTTSEVDSMIDESVSGKVDTSTFNVYSGNVASTLDGKVDDAEIADMATKTWVGNQGYITEHQDISGKLDVSAFTAYSGAVDTTINSKASQTSLDALNGVVTAHTANTEIHVTSAEKNVWNAKSDFSGDYNDLTNKPTIPTVPTSNTAFTNDAGYITIDAISGKVDTSTYNTYTAATDTALASKADTATTYTKTEVDNAITAATSTKQDTLIAGTNISISGNVISASGGGSITIDPTLDSGSTNAVANSAITNAINDRALKTQAVGSYRFGENSDNKYIRFVKVDTTQLLNGIYYPKINGKGILTTNKTFAQNNYNFNLVETSAVTTSITSGSTDAQVPSAKAVYDIVGDIETLLSQI